MSYFRNQTTTSGITINLLVITLTTVLLGCAPKYYDSIKWQATEVQADGNPAEWSIPLRHYDPESKLNYDFSNDKKNLYVIFRISDQVAQMRVAHAGMEIAIDSAGGKKYPVTLGYPLPSTMSPEKPQEKGEGQDDASDRKNIRKNVIATQDHILLGGFKNIPNGLTPITNDYGIKVGINWDKDGTMYYEAVIPFKTFYKETLTAKDTLKPFAFQVTLEVVPGVDNKDFAQDDNSGNGSRSAGQGAGQRGGGGMPGGSGMGGMGGGMPGAGSGMPGPGMGGSGKPHVPEKNVIAFKMKLSLK